MMVAVYQKVLLKSKRTVSRKGLSLLTLCLELTFLRVSIFALSSKVLCIQKDTQILCKFLDLPGKDASPVY